jgi:hypothetical protein
MFKSGSSKDMNYTPTRGSALSAPLAWLQKHRRSIG